MKIKPRKRGKIFQNALETGRYGFDETVQESAMIAVTMSH